MDIIKKLFVVLVLLTLSTVGYAEEVVSRLEALEKMFEEAKKLRKEHKNHSYDAANEISEMFDKVEKEYQTQGYSNLVNQVRHEFIQEQDLKNKEVMQALANTMTQSQAGFINVADDVSGAPSYLHANITSCGAITINVAAAGEDTFSSTFS